MPEFRAQIRTNRIPILGLMAEQSATAPSSPTEGLCWHDTANKQYKVYLNGDWVRLDSVGSAGVGHTHVIGDVSGLNAALLAKSDTGHTHTKAEVGLANVDNTSDANKPVSTAQLAAINARAPAVHGHALTDANITGILPIAQIPVGTTVNTVAAGNDSRFGAPSAPNGAAGGDLTGTYPNPTVANLAITDAKVAAANKDGAAGVPSMRTIGAGATQVVAGNDARLTNARTPTGTASGDLAGTYPSPTVALLAITDAKVAAANKDGAVGTPSMRTLGLGATQALAGTTRIDQIAVPTTSVNQNNQKIINLATPTAASDAANKAYVDAIAQSLDVKDSVRAATTGNITLSAAQTIDGVAVVAGNRVLVKNQTTASQNGIYVAAAGAWVRSTDMSAGTLDPGAFTFVEEGTVNANSGWFLTNAGAITVGTTALTFVQFSGAGQIEAGSGLTKTGNTLAVGGTTNRIVVGATNVDIAPNYEGQTSITKVGTISTGTWNGAAIPVTSGGTGATTIVGARAALEVPTTGQGPMPTMNAGVWAQIIPAGTTVSTVRFEDAATGEEIILDVRLPAAGGVQARADVSFVAGSTNFRVVYI